MTFTLYGITSFEVQYWDGANWVTVPGGNIVGNNNVWRKIVFNPITTTKIRVLVNDSIDHTVDHSFSRIIEVEAYTSGGSAPQTKSYGYDSNPPVQDVRLAVSLLTPYLLEQVLSAP